MYKNKLVITTKALLIVLPRKVVFAKQYILTQRNSTQFNAFQRISTQFNANTNPLPSMYVPGMGIFLDSPARMPAIG